MLDLFCCPLDAVDDTCLARCRELLAADERQRLQEFRREEAARIYTVTRALLRHVLAEKLGVGGDSLRFVRDANGKPQLADRALHFNLSHGSGWVALAVSADGPVGVDIETSVRRNDILGIARRYFPADEHARLAALDPAMRAAAFCEAWTVKEACVKWSGLGIGRAIAGVGVSIDRVAFDRVAPDRVALDRVALDEGTIALALRPDIAPAAPPEAVLFALGPSVRLAAVCDRIDGWSLQRRLPLGATEPLPAQLLARTQRA